MPQPKSLIGHRAPLLEKLIDLNPESAEDAQDLTFQTRDAVAASVTREIARIIDTRLPWPDERLDILDERADENPDDLVDRETTVVRYGVVDISHLCVRNTVERRKIERLMTEAIRRFEPRLIDPVVRIELRRLGDSAHLEISGFIRLGRALEPLTFSMDGGVRLGGTLKKKIAKTDRNRNGMDHSD